MGNRTGLTRCAMDRRAHPRVCTDGPGQRLVARLLASILEFDTVAHRVSGGRIPRVCCLTDFARYENRGLVSKSLFTAMGC